MQGRYRMQNKVTLFKERPKGGGEENLDFKDTYPYVALTHVIRISYHSPNL